MAQACGRTRCYVRPVSVDQSFTGPDLRGRVAVVIRVNAIAPSGMTGRTLELLR